MKRTVASQPNPIKPERCIHDLLRQQCEHCRDKSVMSHAYVPQLIVYKPDSIQAEGFGLTVGEESGSGKVDALIIGFEPPHNDVRCLRVDSSQVDTQSLSSLNSKQKSELRAILRNIALNAALLFEPRAPLTQREQGRMGPPHCTVCGEVVSFSRGSLGCSECNCYVCSRGHCLCGQGWLKNYLGQSIPPQRRLNCGSSVRRAGVKIAAKITTAGQVLSNSPTTKR